MQEISDSIREKLSARPEPQGHPDPDVLAAYGEQALPAAERLEVIRHLADCGYCREVVSLILPPSAPDQGVQLVLARSRLWIPAFRWGAALAVLAVAAILVLERPKQEPAGQSQIAQVSSVAPNAQPATSAPVSSTTPASIPESAAAPQPRANAGNVSRAASSEPRARERRAAPVAAPLRTPAGFVENGAATTSLAITAPGLVAPLMAQAPQPPPPAAVSRSAGKDYLNTDLLKKETTLETENLVATDTGTLPLAPDVRDSNGKAHAKTFPSIATGDVPSRADAITIVPPNTTAPASGSTDVTTFKTSKGVFRIPSRVREEIGKAVSGIEKGGSGGQASGMFNLGGPTPSFNRGSIEKESTTGNGPLRWRISPDGILQTSTDSTRWHEAYPQGSDLYFKALVTRGSQIWAGGSNATLIHSWNAGVHWETMKVPDSGDITAITIDDGWQVKTSDGQTFVSTDKGKTWVPLQTNPK